MATEKQIKYWKKMKGRSLSKITKYRMGQSQKGGRTLCIDCHKKTDTYAGKIKLYDKR